MSADCVFCRIVAGLLPTTKVFEDETVVAFADLHPRAPVHLLVVPRRHMESVLATTPADEALLGHLLGVARQLASERGLPGYKLQFNVGAAGGQVVPHVHLHLLGGWTQPVGEGEA